MKFKVGNNVSYYREGNRHIGVITSNVGTDRFLVRSEDGVIHRVHSKQCRRLIKRPRDRIWVIFDDEGGILASHHECDGSTEFVEVRKKK